MSQRSAFWDDHQAAMSDPEYRHNFILKSRRIAVIDAIVNALVSRPADAQAELAALRDNQ